MVCISVETLYAILGLLALVFLALLLWRRKRQDRLRIWRDEIKEAQLINARQECPTNLVRRERENIDNDMKDPKKTLDKNARLQGKYSEGKRLSVVLQDIKENYRQGKIKTSELGIPEDELDDLVAWFQKNF